MKTNEAITILEQIATIPSVSGAELMLGKTIATILEKIGLTVTRMAVDEAGCNVIGTIGTPRLFLASHMDTVPGGKPFGKSACFFTGRGVCDAKASIAAMIGAASQAIKAGNTDFGLAFTVGEETDFRGALRLIENIQPLPFTVVGEPTSLTLVNGQFGCSVFSIQATGKSAHSSKPDEGVNAIDLILEAIAKIKMMKRTGKTFFSVCQINGGIADNIIPDNATVVVSFRTDPTDSTDYGALIKKTIGNEFIVTQELALPGVFTTVPKELAFLQKTVRTVTYGSELSLYKNGVILGPGDIKVAHSDDEIIGLEEVVQASKLYEQIIENFQD